LGWEGANRMANDSGDNVSLELVYVGWVFWWLSFFLFLVVTYLVNWTLIDILPTKSRMKKNINGTKWNIVKFIKLFFLKEKIYYNKFIMFKNNNLIIVASSAK
jgi:hypothetical protein